MNKRLVILSSFFMILLLMSNVVFATGVSVLNTDGNTNTINSNYYDNVFKLMLGNDGQLGAKFDLRDVIPENIIPRDQGNANNCWDFASIGALESTLALKRYKNGLSTKKFDFSEAHLKYGARYDMFLNNEKNNKGLDFNKEDGGNFREALSYMTNGFGPIDEKWLKYNSREPRIELSSIKNITQSATPLDTIDFSIINNTDEGEVEKLIPKIKNHIKNYGGVYFSLNYFYGDGYSNLKNHARYCDVPLQENQSPTHAVLLVGWDDNYSASNFKKNPGKNGAWIFKNSYGNLSSYEYLSYYDKTSYTETFGFVDAEEGKNFDYRYQHQVLPPIIDYHVNKGPVINQLSVAEVYSRDTANNGEKITRLSFDVPVAGNYEFFVNGDNDDLTKLKSVSNKYLDKGFHTIKLDSPVVLTGSKFAIGVKIPDVNNEFHLNYEPKSNIPGFTASENSTGETFINFVDNNNSERWQDFIGRGKGNSSLKAYVMIPGIKPHSTKIKIISDPNKLEYAKGLEDLDLTGGKIIVSMSNGETVTKDFNDSNVKITGFDNSVVGPKNITVDYMGNKAVFVVNIVDPPKEIVSLKFKKYPTKQEYFVNEPLDKSGGVLEAVYTGGNTYSISTDNSDVKFSTPNMSISGKKNVTVTYDGKSINYEILVKDKPVTVNKIEVMNMPDKVNYVQETDELNLSGGFIRVIYSDKTIMNIPMSSSDVKVTGFDNSKVGKNTLTVNYKSKSVKFDVNIVEKPKVVINNIEIANNPNKVVYKKGENLDLSGGLLRVFYSDGNVKVVPMDSEDISYSNYNSNKLGLQTIMLKYNGFSNSVYFNIQIIEADKPKPNVDENKIIENQIVANQIKDNQIINNQIVSNQIIENQVVTNKIVENHIVENKITENKIIENQIINNKIEENREFANRVKQNQIISDQEEANKVIDNQIAENKIIQENEYNNRVLQNQLIANSIVSNIINNNVVDENKIQNEIANNDVVQNHIIQNKISDDENKIPSGNTNTTDNIHNIHGDVNPDEDKDLLSTVKAEVVKADKYVYTDEKKNYAEVVIKISDLNLDDVKKFKLSYRIAGNGGEKFDNYDEIDNLKFTKQGNGFYTTTIKVNSKNLKNLSDVIISDKLFIYLKLNDKKDNKDYFAVLPVGNSAKIENHINDKKVDKIDDETMEKYKDNTVSKGSLPQTGALPIFMISVISIVLIAVFSYNKFKNINK